MQLDLLPYQREAFAWAASRPRIGLFLEMRLGKSRIAIAWAEKQTPTDQRILVVCPNAVVTSWIDEFLKLKAPAPADLRHGLSQEDWRRWNLINYEALLRPKPIHEYAWGCVILDESPRIKNPKAKTSQIVCDSFRHCPRKAILSGNPAPESPLDYYQQFKFLFGQFLGMRSYWNFRANLCLLAGYDYVPTKETLKEIRATVQTNAYILKRRDAGVGSTKVRETRLIDLPGKDLKAYRKWERDFCVAGKETIWQTELTLLLHRYCGGSLPTARHGYKRRELTDLLTGELAGEPVVIWFRFLKEIRDVAKALAGVGIDATALTGKTPRLLRRERMRAFQAGKVQALLVSVSLGAYGLDLSRADTAIFFSNSYSLDLRSQAEDRIIHPRKTAPVLILDLAVRQTVDTDLLEILSDKRAKSLSVLESLKDRINRRWQTKPIGSA